MLLKLVVIFGYILFRCTYASDTPTLHTPVGVEGKEKQEEPLVDSAPDLIHGIVKDIDKDQNVISKALKNSAQNTKSGQALAASRPGPVS